MDSVSSYLDGAREKLRQGREYAAGAGVATAGGLELYNKNVDGSIWDPFESGAGVVPRFFPGLDSWMHGVGFLSVSKYAMEPDTFPLDRLQSSAGVEFDYPDALKPLVGVGAIGIGGGVLLKEGYMEAGVHNLETAGRFLNDFAHYNTGAATGIDHDDYWDVFMDTVPTALYCQWKGYNTALKKSVSERINSVYEAAVSES